MRICWYYNTTHQQPRCYAIINFWYAAYQKGLVKEDGTTLEKWISVPPNRGVAPWRNYSEITRSSGRPEVISRFAKLDLGWENATVILYALRKGISSFCLVDASDYDSYCHYLSDESVSTMVSSFEDCIWEQVTDDLIDALEDLPERLQYLEADQFFSKVEIYGAEEIVKSYLDELDYDYSFDKDEDANCEMDPVDAIFQR